MAIGMLKDLANVEKLAVAQAHLGEIYAGGFDLCRFGVAKNFGLALKWWKRAIA